MEEKGSLRYVVQREVLDEQRLEEVAQRGTLSTPQTREERLKESLRCSGPRLKQAVLGLVPVLDWLPKYPIRENAVGDLVSGCSVGIMHLPQGMAYAMLAALPPVIGLYTSFFPVLVYFIFGTSRHISIGTFAVLSIVIGGVTEKLAPDSHFYVNGTNGSQTLDIEARDALRVQVACSLTVLTGIFQILLGVVRFGFVVTYLSEPLVRGYTTGSACHVCVSQLKYLFGVSPFRFAGPLSLIYTLVDICRLLPETRVSELVISLVSLAVLILVKEINDCYKKKLPLPIPIELVVIIAATIISHFCGFKSEYHVDVVGKIPSGLKAPKVPDASFFSEIVGDAFTVAIVGYAINISLGKTFALKHGYKVDSNQELIALGLSNTIGSFFQCYSVTCSLSRSLIQESTGGKTQVAAVVSSIIVLITVLKIGSLFEDLPKAILATIVFANLKGMFKQLTDVPMLWRTNKVDLLVWLVTFVSTILLNLDLGLAVSIGFALLTFIFKTQLPRYSILGWVPGTDLYLDTDSYREAQEIPGIKIFRSSATICYTNAEMYFEALQEKTGVEISQLLTAKKKREAELKKEARKEKKKQKKENRDASISALSLTDLSDEKATAGLTQRNGHPSANGLSKGQVNGAYQHDPIVLESDADVGRHGDDARHGDEEEEEVEDGRWACGSDVHSIILDVSVTSSVDSVTASLLRNIFRDFGEIDVDIYLTGCQACVVEELETAAFFSESIPKSRLFVTVHDAVLHILEKQGQGHISLDIPCNTQF